MNFCFLLLWLFLSDTDNHFVFPPQSIRDAKMILFFIFLFVCVRVMIALVSLYPEEVRLVNYKLFVPLKSIPVLGSTYILLDFRILMICLRNWNFPFCFFCCCYFVEKWFISVFVINLIVLLSLNQFHVFYKLKSFWTRDIFNLTLFCFRSGLVDLLPCINSKVHVWSWSSSPYCLW